MSITLHRFTPPTCTLEIRGNKSILSRWSEQELLKQFQFQLNFDDPRLTAAKQVQIKGNKNDLELLKTAVDQYIQNYLHPSLRSSPGLTSDSNQVLKRQPHPSHPYLEPLGLTNHNLFLANLNHDADAEQIKLSTVQLFDLVTVLEAYTAKVATLPKLNQAQVKQTKMAASKSVPLWGSVAAMTVLTVGIATVMRFTQVPAQSPNIASSSDPTANSSASEIPELDQVVPPKFDKTAESASPQPKLAEPLKSVQRLPPPPAVDTPKPQPAIPNPEDYSLSKVAKRSGLNNSVPPDQKTNQKIKKSAESVVVIPPETKSQQSTSARSANQNKATVESETTNIDDAKTQTDSISPAKTIAKPTSQVVQLKEVQAYFAERWQPPTDLKQSLEYRLYLSADGSVERIIPLGKAAKLYLSQTNIPVRGEAFVSPLSTPQPSTIRLLLNPDGGVKTLQE